MSVATDIDVAAPPRQSRMSAFCPTKTMADAHAVVVGCGAVGRQVAQQLAAMGVGSLTLADHDLIDDSNTGPQMYPPAAIGRHKTVWTAEDCERLNPDVRLTSLARRVGKADWKLFAGAVVVLCVDSIEVRAALYEAAVKGKAAAVLDGRVQGESIRVLSQPDPKADSPYVATLFRADEAVTGSCAGSRMSTYGAATAASLLSAKVAQFLRGHEDGFTDHSLHLGTWDLFETPSGSLTKGAR